MARHAKGQLPSSEIGPIANWHGRYAHAARALADDLTARGMAVALPESGENEEIAEATAHAILSNSGQPAMEILAMKRCDPALTLRGSARLFLRNAAPLHVQEWLRELAGWEERWLAELEREDKPS